MTMQASGTGVALYNGVGESHNNIVSRDTGEPEIRSDGEEEGKDATEEELERLIFGDVQGFRDGIEKFQDEVSDEDESEQKYLDEPDRLREIQDDELFLLDAAPLRQAEKHDVQQPNNNALAYRSAHPPAWEDSDDERMSVSLMSAPRLRKLRRFEGEDLISGGEYTNRLRQQYEILHPRPAWADWSERAVTRKSRKRRRGSQESEEDDDESSDNESDDFDSDTDVNAATQPLAQLLRSNMPMTRVASNSSTRKRPKLRPEVIGLERMRDITPNQPHAITSVAVHPSLPLLLSSGLSSTLYLHHLHPHPTPPDPPNPLLTSLHLKHTPLTTSAFSSTSASTHHSSGPQVYLSSRRRYFHIWDLPSGQIQKITRVFGQQASQQTMEILKPSPCGRYVGLKGSVKKAGSGIVNILDRPSSQWVAQANVDGAGKKGGVADFIWWSDGNGMSIIGHGGEVSEWSIIERRVIWRWQDEGAIGTTTMALGGKLQAAKGGKYPIGPERWAVIGSTAGIVNIYDRSTFTASSPGSSTTNDMTDAKPAQPAPYRTIENLVTPISHLAFSPCGQLLAIASRWKRDALRLVHLPSAAVYKNWPTAKTPLGRISALTIGEIPIDGNTREDENAEKKLVLIVGNEAGSLRGWEITG